MADVRLQCPAPDQRVDSYRLAAPQAHVGWIPPGGVISDPFAAGWIPPSGSEFQPPIPCVVVGLDKKTSSIEEIRLDIRLTAAVYDPGHQTRDGDLVICESNKFDGYKTLLNFMDKLECSTLRAGVIAGAFLLDSPIESKMYEDQAFPYWYGYLKFTLKQEAYPETRFASLLD